MIERTPSSEDRDQQPSNIGSGSARTAVRAAVTMRRGRPIGTDYRIVDGPLHEEMRDLIKRRVVPTLTAAADLWLIVRTAVAPRNRGDALSALLSIPRVIILSFAYFKSHDGKREAPHVGRTTHKGVRAPMQSASTVHYPDKIRLRVPRGLLTRSGLQPGSATPRRRNGRGRRCYAAWRHKAFSCVSLVTAPTRPNRRSIVRSTHGLAGGLPTHRWTRRDARNKATTDLQDAAQAYTPLRWRPSARFASMARARRLGCRRH